MIQRPRVLLIADECNPEWTSVPLLAYYWYTALREYADISLVTQIRNRPAFQRQDGSCKDVTFIDSERVAGPFHKLGRWLTLGHAGALTVKHAISWPAYIYFEMLTWQRFGSALTRGKFDLVHRLTPLSPTVPSPMVRSCPVPFILGPLNGSLPWAPHTHHIRKREGEWLAPVRRTYRLLPYWRQTFQGAALTIAGARHVLDELPLAARRRSVVMAENGVDIDRFSPDGKRPCAQGTPFIILFVGRLVPFKQPCLLIEALAAMKHCGREVRLDFVGDGPEMAAMVSKARDTGVAAQVRFHGEIPHGNLPQYYLDASVLALPSVHESGGAVLLEAMACGLPCVVLDYGGPAEYVTETTGVKLPIGRRDEMIGAYARTFDALLENPSLLKRMAQASRNRAVTEYGWDAKARRMAELYAAVAHERQLPRVRPDTPRCISSAPA